MEQHARAIVMTAILDTSFLFALTDQSDRKKQYADNKLDFTDAAIVAISERLAITRVYTLDRRDFSVIRPKHCDYFELLP
jgi:predicted nucleic acid-binding protein